MGDEDGGGRTKRFAAILLSWRACLATLGEVRQ